ncbi:MAG TPA: response regulator [Terracidiphilus sp.]|nr:response regulator [Terracidiphilus sp.]
MTNAARHTVVVVAVDDDFRVRESIESLLESAGFAPELFSSAEEFLRSGKLSIAACVITDVRMSGMDGLELQRRIRLERPTLPVIFISAHNDPETRTVAFNEGAVHFLQKPFDGADLLEKIRAALATLTN